MVYLYNNDEQFGTSYWPTVDWYRLPGTTVDTRPLVDENTFQSYRSKEAFVGGAVNDSDAAVAMQLNKDSALNGGSNAGMDLKAKKSWFVLDGQIVSLGADISGTSPSGIETIIDNRMFDQTSSYQLVDQTGKDVATRNTTTVTASDWFLLKSSKDNQSLGYFMLEDQKIQTKQEARTGTYQAIDDAFPSATLYNETYQKIIVDHGTKAANDSYAYLTMPNATEARMKDMKDNQPIQIIENSSNIQAVKQVASNTLAATVWSQTGGTVEGLSVDKPVTFLYHTTGDQWTLSISDPSQTNQRVTVKLPQEITEVIAQDAGVQVIDQQTVQIDTTNGLGKTFQLTAKTTPKEAVVEVTGVSIANQSLEVIKKGERLPVNVTVQPANATDQQVKWTSSNSAIAEVTDGKVVGKKAGTTKVTATSSNGKTATFTVRVTP